MEFTSEQIEKVKFIYKSQIKINENKNEKDKWSFVWNIGTDFFLHLARINKLFFTILKDFNINLETENIYLEWKTSSVKKYSEKRYYFNLYKGDLNENKYQYITSLNFKKGNNIEFIYKDKSFFNEEESLSYLHAKSTLTQFLTIMSSLGYIGITNELNPNNYFNLIFASPFKEHYKEFDKQILAKNFIKNFEKYFDIKYLKGYQIRDIFLGIHFFFLNEISKTKILEIEDIFVMKISNKSNKIPLKKVTSTLEKHFDTQTTLKRWIKNNDSYLLDFFNNINDFLYQKYKFGWLTENITTQSKNLEYYISKNSGRIGQAQYRQMLLNDLKRMIWDENEQNYYINRNDLIMGIENEYAIEASHILDFSKCETDEEKYDPENGLLLEPTLHSLFDKNLITFNEMGELMLSKNEYQELVKIIKKDNLQNSIYNKVLTPETKKYIKQRIDKNNINLTNYEVYKK